MVSNGRRKSLQRTGIFRIITKIQFRRRRLRSSWLSSAGEMSRRDKREGHPLKWGQAVPTELVSQEASIHSLYLNRKQVSYLNWNQALHCLFGYGTINLQKFYQSKGVLSCNTVILTLRTRNMSSPDRTLRPLGQTISAHRNTVRLSPTMPAVTAL